MLEKFPIIVLSFRRAKYATSLCFTPKEIQKIQWAGFKKCQGCILKVCVCVFFFQKHCINTDKLYIHPLLFTNYIERKCLKAQQALILQFQMLYFSMGKQK